MEIKLESLIHEIKLIKNDKNLEKNFRKAE